MAGAERAAFEETLKQDTALQQEVAAYKDIIAGIEQAETDAFRGMMQGWEKQIKEQSQPQQAKVRRLFSPRITMAMAAVVVILLTFTFVFNPFGGSSNPFQSSFQPYADKITVMGEGEDGFDQQKANEAMELYKAEKYGEALPLLKELADENTDMVILKIYQGIAEMQTDDYDAAYASFERVKTSGTSYQYDGEWYEALLLIKQEDQLATEAALQKIIAKDAHPYQKQAKELLEKM